KVKRIPIAGGTALTICDADNLYGASWALNDYIYFGQFSSVGRRGIFRVSARGSKADAVFAPDAAAAISKGATPDVAGSDIAYGPEILPNGHDVIFTIAPSR